MTRTQSAAAGFLALCLVSCRCSAAESDADGVIAQIHDRIVQRALIAPSVYQVLQRRIVVDSQPIAEFAERWNAERKASPGGYEVTVSGDSVPPRWYRLSPSEKEPASLPDYEFRPGIDGVAYVRWRRCAPGHALAILAELDKLDSVRGIVLDVRGNPGGMLLESVLFTERWLKKGMVVVKLFPSAKDMRLNTPEQVFHAVKGGDRRTPIVVLTDSFTGSTAEVIAGIVRGNSLGSCVGRKTRGDGLAFVTYARDDGTSHVKPLLIRVEGLPFYHNSGIEPDEEIPFAGGSEDAESFEGACLRVAVKRLHGKTAPAAAGTIPAD